LPRIATIQNLYNLTARHYETSLLDETCYRENVSLLAYSRWRSAS
jgi:aryl-alcohol dehydrogenase-like predicted oxidoreductase